MPRKPLVFKRQDPQKTIKDFERVTSRNPCAICGRDMPKFSVSPICQSCRRSSIVPEQDIFKDQHTPPYFRFDD